MKLLILAGLPLFLMVSFRSVAMDFDSPDHSPFAEIEDDPDQRNMPELEAEQPEMRLNRSFSMGLGIGESVPGAVISLVASRNIDDQTALEVILGEGNRRSNDQAEGETSFSNKTRMTLVDARFLWWPSPSFPFELDLGLNLARMRGSIRDGDGSSGSYELYAFGIGGGVGVGNIFDNGVWFRWTILSGRYIKIFKGRYSNMTSERMSSVREDLSGLKLVGVANVTFGYSW